jgi:hypothetical protein
MYSEAALAAPGGFILSTFPVALGSYATSAYIPTMFRIGT